MTEVVWRKLDGLGLGSCRLTALSRGWRLQGCAVFVERRRVCHFAYDVVANRGFRTTRASVTGFFGKERIDIRCESPREGEWRINGRNDSRLAGCVDVDFGFTPATNLLAVRRLDLRIGESGEARAAFLNLPSGRFSVLPQRYERVGRTEYAYEAPTVGYAAILRVTSNGFVRHYPGLFELAWPRIRQ